MTAFFRVKPVNDVTNCLKSTILLAWNTRTFVYNKSKNMKTDSQLQQDVQESLKWEPLLYNAEIGVSVKNGVVTLTGSVDSYSKKIEAERAVKNVKGVKALAETIEIKLGETTEISDTEIAIDVMNSIKFSWLVPLDKVIVKVESGWVTLEGELQWDYQRSAAKRAVGTLTGVKGVTNNLKIKSEAHNEIEEAAIKKAYARSWSLNDKDIEVKVSGKNVKLTGIVHSIYQKEEAGRIAWNAPGVWSLDNELVIEY